MVHSDTETSASSEKSTDELVVDGISYSYLDREKHGVSGMVEGPIKFKEQDKEALPLEGYMVVWFPRVEGVGAARIGRFDMMSFSQTPHAAIVKSMDPYCQTYHDKWSKNQEAGMKVIKVRISQLEEEPNDDRPDDNKRSEGE